MTLLLQGLHYLGIGFAFGYSIGSMLIGDFGVGMISFSVFTLLVVIRGLT